MISTDYKHPQDIQEAEANRSGIYAMKVVILEDDKTFASLLCHSLVKAGFSNVDVFHHPDDLLAEKNLSPDIGIFDVNLPGKNGFEVLDDLKERMDEKDDVPIIFLTADERHEIKKDALKYSAQPLLDKSQVSSELILRVENLLKARTLHLGLQDKMEDLEHELASREDQLEQVNLEMLIRLAHAVEASHIFHDNQIWQVASLSAQLALELGLSNEYVSLILRAARLHDIGKIALPPHILDKPSALTDTEFDLVKTHTSLGAQLLSGSKHPLMQLAESIALTHHERWDGQGYPKGLKETEIPLEGRILAVADSFHALTRDRPHQPKMSVKDAVSEIKKNAHTQFDPQVVNALLRLMNKGELNSEASLAGL